MDHCSKFIFIRNQVSLGAGKTLVGKHGFEFLLCTFGFFILIYYGKEAFLSRRPSWNYYGSGA